MDGKVFSEETSELLKGIITEAVKPKVPALVRPAVKPVVGFGLSMLNKYADQVIPDKVDTYLNQAIINANKGNWDLSAVAMGKAMDELIDIPNVDDAHEENVFITVTQAIVQGVRVWIEKKKAVKSA